MVSVFLFAILQSILKTDLFAFKEGYSFVWLLVCYVIGAYIRRADLLKLGRKNIFIFISLALCLLLGKYAIYAVLNRNIRYMIEYTSPFVLLMAIVLLNFFKDMTFRKENTVMKYVMKFLAGTAFDVYIIHCHILIFDYIIKDSFLWIIDYPVVLLPILLCISVISIYVLLSIIGFLRRKLFAVLHMDKVIRFISDKFIIFE